MRSLPPHQRAIPLALISSERRVDGLKGNVPDLDQLDDRHRDAIGQRNDADVACSRQRQPEGSELDRQAGGRSLSSGLNKRREMARMEKKKADRRQENLAALGMDTRARRKAQKQQR